MSILLLFIFLVALSASSKTLPSKQNLLGLYSEVEDAHPLLDLKLVYTLGTHGEAYCFFDNARYVCAFWEGNDFTYW